jgi:hypothetical protein
MDGPKTVTANWRTVYSAGFFVFVAVVIGAPIAAAVVLLRMKKAKAETVAPSSVPSERKCVACGVAIPFDSEYCDECGARQIQGAQQ